MLFPFVVASQLKQVELDDRLVAEYRQTVEEYQSNPRLWDRVRREAHNKVSRPVFWVVMEAQPELSEKEAAEVARNLVTSFFAPSPVGQRSLIGEIRSSYW